MERLLRGRVTSVTVSSEVLFDFGKVTLTPVARATVARLAGERARARGTITATGYTDSIGTAQANARLSLARARTVRPALLAAFPQPRPVTATGQGAAMPVAPNVIAGRDNPSGRAMNRRVVITYR